MAQRHALLPATRHYPRIGALDGARTCDALTSRAPTPPAQPQSRPAAAAVFETSARAGAAVAPTGQCGRKCRSRRRIRTRGRTQPPTPTSARCVAPGGAGAPRVRHIDRLLRMDWCRSEGAGGSALQSGRVCGCGSEPARTLQAPARRRWRRAAAAATRGQICSRKRERPKREWPKREWPKREWPKREWRWRRAAAAATRGLGTDLLACAVV
jgi:hypothetical protein